MLGGFFARGAAGARRGQKRPPRQTANNTTTTKRCLLEEHVRREAPIALIRLPFRFKNLVNLGAGLVGNLGFEGNFYTAREALKIVKELIKQKGMN